MPIVVITGKTALRKRVDEGDGGFGQPLGSGGADIVLAQDFQHRRTRQAHDQRGTAQPDGGGRNAQHESKRAPGLRRLVVDRQQAEPVDEGHQDQQTKPEGGQGQEQQAEDTQHVVQCWCSAGPR